jgi:branched-chain amino acid transport system substrate-binding protein
MLNLLCFVFLLARSPVIEIGVHAPLSGPISDYGIQCLQVLGKKEVSIVADTSNIYSGALALHFKSNFESMGGCTHIIEWDGKSGLSNAMREVNGGTVFLPLYYKAAAGIIQAARAESLDVTFVGADVLVSPELLHTRQTDTEKIYFSTHYFEDKNSDFVQRYIDEYDSPPNSFSALGFDAASLVLLAIERTRGIGSSDMFEAISSIETFDGVTGFFRFEGKRDPLKSIFIVQLQEGKTALVQEL